MTPKQRTAAIISLQTFAVCYAQVAQGPHPAAAFPGDWLQFRSDRKLTGRSRLVGNFAPPAVTSARVPIPRRDTLPTVSFSSVKANLYVNSGAGVQRADVTIQNIRTSDGYTLPTFGFYFLHPYTATQLTLSFNPSDPDLSNVSGLTQIIQFSVDTSTRTVSASNLNPMPAPLQRLLFGLAANLASVFQNATVTVAQGTPSLPVWSVSGVTAAATSFSDVFFQPSPVLWSLFIGARQTSVALQASIGSASTITLPAVDSNVGALAANATWGLGPPTYDLNQNGNPITFPVIDMQEKIGNFIAGSTSFQRIFFDSCFGCPVFSTSPDSPDGANGSGHFYRWQSGAWVEQWKTPAIPLLFAPQTIVGDFDHDGRLEVAVQPWWNIQVYDLLTGALKTSARAVPSNILTGRQYGWHGAFDINGDGTQEIIAIGLFENFVSVMGWKDGQLVKLWDHTMEVVHDLNQTIHSTIPFPVQDIDGDGILDVVTSIFNENSDAKWHVVARDGMTGNLLLDQPDRYLLGMADLNGDGATEMFTIATTGQFTPESGTVDVVSFRNRKQATLLELDGVGLATQSAGAMPLNVNTNNQLRALVAGPITKGGLPVFFTQRKVDFAHGVVELTPWQWANGALTKLGTITGPHLEVLATLEAAPGSPGFLISAAANGNTAAAISANGLSGTVVQSNLINAPLSSPVVGHLRPGDPPTVIVQNALEEMVAFRPSSATGAGTVVWTHAGRGGWTGYDNWTGQFGFSGPLLASLAGDGTLQTVAATRGASGQAQIAAIQPDGSDLWTSDMSRFPGAPPPPNEPGIALLLAGRFRNIDRDDVLVAARTETVTSAEINLLDGGTGGLVWTDKNGALGVIRPPTHESPGIQYFGIYDWNHDGLDEVVGTSLNTYWVKDGTDKNLINGCFVVYFTDPACWVFQPDATWSSINFSPGNGLPVIADFLNNGTDTILYGGSTYLLGLIDPGRGKGLWQTPPFPGTPGYLQGVGDLDGDGTLSLVSAGGSNATAILTVNRSDTGELLWSIPLPGCGTFGLSGGAANSGLTPTPVSVGDINGDGRDEAVFGCGTKIYVVGADPGNRSGKILWTLDLGPGFSRLDTPILADAEGDGRLQIIVVGSNGYIYGIGSPPSSSPPAANAPVMVSDGVVEGATFRPGQIAPGSWFTIRGTNLSDGKYQPSATPLPQQLGGTVVTVNGQVARLNYVGPDQINAEMPPEMPVGPARVVVTTKAGSSKSATVQIVPAMPEIFQYGVNRAVAQNASDYTLNGPNNAVPAGGSLVVYFTGGGLVNGDRRTGVPAASTTLMQTKLATTVTIGGQQVGVAFSGLTPGSIGLYQVNITVPTNLSPGDYPVAITVGGVTGSPAVVSVK
ncbi:MAG: VCBS repeat-containing protein [Bryobacterales bacterium]|nr:VCBS repeat-containing protein [Bryobacterales bacterium]